jgi:chorismate mutase/prephenate dehydratase
MLSCQSGSAKRRGVIGMAKRKKTKTKADSEKKRSSGAAPSANSLVELRRELDAADEEILRAINGRGEIVQKIGRAKRAENVPVYDAAREAEVVDRLASANAGPLSADAVRAVFREIISGTRALQKSIHVAYLGPEFTFSHLAAIERFGQSTELVPVGTIAAVFEEVERGQVEFGVVPMENSTDGRVSDTLECFARSPARICGEVQLRIHHCLLGIGSREDVQKVFSKVQPLSQCRNWLATHLPKAAISEFASTAGACQQAKGDSRAAAIASRQAGIHYGLPVIVDNIEDNPDNVTRFAVISKSAATEPTGRDKTALMLEIAHRPGALADAMAIFKRAQLNMTWIESFPIPGHRGSYLFFIEFVGHPRESRAKKAVAALAKQSRRLEVLGSYAQAEPVG